VSKVRCFHLREFCCSTAGVALRVFKDVQRLV
jgi:hypothetical protein